MFISVFAAIAPGSEGRGDTPSGGMPPGSPNPDPISTKKYHFLHPFSDQISKIQTIFQTWPLGGNYVIISWTRAQTKNFSNAFRTRIFLLLRCYSFGIGTTNTFIRFRSSLENHTRFQTKQKQKGKKTNLCGGTYLYGLYREVPLSPPPPPPPPSWAIGLQK